MADEQLRMTAVVNDGFTAPLKRLKSELNSIKSPPALDGMSKQMLGWRSTVQQLNNDLKAGSTAFSGFGLATFSVVGALGALGAGMRSFAGQTQSIRLFGKEIGLTSDRIRALSEVGQRFGVSAETMQGGLRAFAGTMDQVKNKWGEAYGALREMNLGKLADDLATAPNMSEAVDRLFAGLANIPDAERRRRVLSMLGLPEDWSTIVTAIPGKFRETVDEIERQQGRVGKATEDAASGFETQMSRMRIGLDGLRVAGFGALLPEVNNLLTTLNNPQVFGAIKSEVDGLTIGVRDLIGEIHTAVDFLGNLKDKAREAITGSKDGKIGVVEDLRPSDEIAKRQAQIEKLAPQLQRTESILAQREARGDTEGASEARRRRDALLEQTKRLADEIQALRRGGATVQQQSFGGGGIGSGEGSLIHRAAFGSSTGFSSSPEVGFRGVRGPSLGGPGSLGGDPGTRIAPGSMTGTGMGHIASKAERLAYIRAEAAKRGIDPDIAATVATREGLGKYGGDEDATGRYTSFGDFQLHYPGVGRNTADGLGSKFTRQTGLDARDPRTWREQTQFALDEAAKGGWTPWHGWRGHPRAGLNGARPIGVTRTADEPAGMFPPLKTRADVAKAAGTADFSYPLGWGRREVDGASGGDSMMGRLFGPGGVSAPVPQIDAKGSVKVMLGPGLDKLPAKVEYDGLFKEVTVGRGTQLA